MLLVLHFRKRLQDLAENLQQMEEAQEEMAKNHQQQLQKQRYLQSTRYIIYKIKAKLLENNDILKDYFRCIEIVDI